jgi:hypothetical protein
LQYRLAFEPIQAFIFSNHLVGIGIAPYLCVRFLKSVKGKENALMLLHFFMTGIAN